MGEDFYHAVLDAYNLQYPEIVFSDFFMDDAFDVSSVILLPDGRNPPKRMCIMRWQPDMQGFLEVWGKYFHSGQLIISEHGIYTREREEELIKAEWVQKVYKKIWIQQFRKMSKVSYERADIVTSLYQHAQELQIELGCPKEKTIVTPNGINYERFKELPQCPPEQKEYIHIGAVLRVTPIKDVKR